MSKQITRKSMRGTDRMAYPGMAAAFLAMGASADGQIVYTDVDPDSVLTNEQMEIDFDMDGNVDVVIGQVHVSTSGGLVYDLGIVAGNVLGGTTNGFVYPSVVPNGSPIGPTDPGWQNSVSTGYLAWNAVLSSNVYQGGDWVGQFGYLGCRFTNTNGDTLYAWVYLQVGGSAQQVTVIDYAYEQIPGMAIAAGDMGTVGVGQRPSPLGVRFYPNPVRDIAEITFPSGTDGEATVRVMNSMGQVLVQKDLSVNATSGTFQLDLSDLPAGTYFMTVRNGGKEHRQKIVKIA
ncbi:MAG: T9SS type A sorting domain-containing protein [Flavobacteriales bacterium]|nr:T9SS type A sorting domain-containing protein [Flavobacteriales bacterium]